MLALLILANQRYLFHTELHESGDPAADTLSVLRAQHAEELHGASTRWNFYHPGPALFYGEALGEATFYRTWHLTPTPYNAQVLAVMLLLASLFAAGISVAARWVRGGVFVALALTFAALHFGAVGGRFLVVSTGSAHVTTLVFFGLLVAAASVAAGQGEDLPLLVLTGGLLLHLHVAQPLFVGPMFVLAYLGLAWSCRQRRRPATETVPATPAVSLVKETDASPAPPFPVRTSVSPWRIYRLAHVLAVFIAVVFALPVVVDALFPHGNFRQILAFVRQHPGGGRPWLDSLTYFLHFAVYQPSEPGASSFAGGAIQADLAGFVAHHPKMTLLWLGALLSPLLPLAARAWRGKDPVLLGTSPTAVPTGHAAPGGRWRFLGWLWIVWLAGLGLTLVWGHLQPGEMFYADAWFNYSVWYVLALLAAGSLADAFDTLNSRSERPLLWKSFVVALCAVGTFFALSRNADRFRADEADNEPHRAQQQTVTNLLATEPAGTPHAKLLVFPHDARESATGVAALLARRGDAVYVLPEWANLFGEDHVLPGWERVFNQPADTNPGYEVWHFVPRSELVGVPSTGPLLSLHALVPGGLPIDPAKDPAITWTGEHPNFRAYCGKGWNTFEDHADFTTTVEKNAALQFRAVPIPSTADVRITFDFKPYLPAGRRDSQRMTVHYNGHDLGTFQVGATEVAAPRVAVPAAVWNRYASGLLTLHFPDAISPQAAGEGSDTRLLGFAARRISFGLLLRVEAPAAPAAEPPAPTPTEDPEPTPTATPEKMPHPDSIPEATPEPSPTPKPIPVVPIPTEAPAASPTGSVASPSLTPSES